MDTLADLDADGGVGDAVAVDDGVGVPDGVAGFAGLGGVVIGTQGDALVIAELVALDDAPSL